ncbi:type II toxin-antitoxin system HicB family antitoxin [Candidatus Magnetaquicoccus inordinatus]|uniref:type II toxin-antitoxin system HicB family antitoxin n=1 Tax=Candidatus Magnetaquicoccus inordinatus TaxID=2496818 RepID=UPI00102B0929|nr:type II toxin-antitoxin system HicB family antitoxin [Candidatus Magnetaquicoccus inordinatus]
MAELEEYPFEIQSLSEADGGGYLISFPDFPGCMSDGETPDEAIANGRDALQAFIAMKKEFRDYVPEPGEIKLPFVFVARGKKDDQSLLQASSEKF